MVERTPPAGPLSRCATAPPEGELLFRRSLRLTGNMVLMLWRSEAAEIL